MSGVRSSLLQSQENFEQGQRAGITAAMRLSINLNSQKTSPCRVCESFQNGADKAEGSSTLLILAALSSNLLQSSTLFTVMPQLRPADERLRLYTLVLAAAV
jgi:hypothetical protein